MSIDNYFEKNEISVRNAVNNVNKKTLTLDIVCKFCGDLRGTVVLKYKSNNDQGLFRAACICEKCLQKNNTKFLNT